MRKVGEALAGFCSFNTCEYKGRLFSFTQDEGRLVVTELVIGSGLAFLELETQVNCGATQDSEIACCPFGENILVMSGTKGSVFAALVSIGDVKLSGSDIYLTMLEVVGSVFWLSSPFLCQTSANRVLLYFNRHRSMWYCDIANNQLSVRKLRTPMPTRGGFSTLPIRLPDGRLLVAGSDPVSTLITLISPGDEPSFEKIADIPGEARKWNSSILLAGRFVIGFGGSGSDLLNDLWLLDLQTCKVSHTKKEGQWHSRDCSAVLAIQRGLLYIIGGWNATSINLISLVELSELVQNNAVKSAFKAFLNSLQSYARSLPAKSESSDFGSVFDSALDSSTSEFDEIKQMLSKERLNKSMPSLRLGEAEDQAALVTALEAKLEEARMEIASLKAKLGESGQKSANAPALGTLQMHLPACSVPAFPFPEKWKVGPSRFQALVAATNEHQRTLPQKSSVLREYQKAFGPFLDERLSQKLISVVASLPCRMPRIDLTTEVAMLVRPGQFILENTGSLQMGRPYPLRPRDKFLDSELTQYVFQLIRKEVKVSGEIFAFAPPGYRSALSALNSSDPLVPEAEYVSTSRLRRSIRASSLISSVEEASSLDESIVLLLKARRLRDLGFAGPLEAPVQVPWLGPRTHTEPFQN